MGEGRGFYQPPEASAAVSPSQVWPLYHAYRCWLATFIHQPRLAGTLAPPATVDAFAAPPHDPLSLFGHAVIGWRWLEQAIRAEEGLARGDCADADFYRGKLQAARYFLTWEVPGCHHELALLEARDDVCSSMQEEWF